MRFYTGITALLFFLPCLGQAQQYFSKTGSITFVSEAPLEKIEGTNQNAYVVFDAATGKMEWSVLIKGFEFDKALMQEHFNENYMESTKYPKALFKGTVDNLAALDLTKDGTSTAMVSGTLTVHGISRPFSTKGIVVKKNNAMSVSSDFELLLADYNIDIPKVVRENISKTVQVKVSADLQILKK